MERVIQGCVINIYEIKRCDRPTWKRVQRTEASGVGRGLGKDNEIKYSLFPPQPCCTSIL